MRVAPCSLHNTAETIAIMNPARHTRSMLLISAGELRISTRFHLLVSKFVDSVLWACRLDFLAGLIFWPWKGVGSSMHSNVYSYFVQGRLA